MVANKIWDAIWVDINIASMQAPDYGIIERAALAVADGKIAWLGPLANLPDAPELLAAKVLTGKAAWVTPALIDCHTHLVYAGRRANEFALRLQGKTYAEIAAQGGGIQATVNATRAASFEALYQAAAQRLSFWLEQGVGCIEIKSGYGLDFDTEQNMLRVARRLQEHYPIKIVTTYLGAHCCPVEYQGQPESYIRWICDDALPKLHEQGLVDMVDAFCEQIAFSVEQLEPLFECAQALGLAVKCHAEQLSYGGGAALAARFKACSVDHLEYLEPSDLSILQQSGTVAVLLPGAYYYLNETKLPPVAALSQHNIPIAIATDHNPGSSPLSSVLLAMNMGCVLFQLTPLQALQAVTCHAAKALQVEQQRGRLEVGLAADFVVWDIEHPDDLAYTIGTNPIIASVIAGQTVFLHPRRS